MNKNVLDQLRSNPRARAPGSTQPSPRTHPQRPQRPPRRRLPLLPLLIIFGFVALGAAGWSAVNSPALASLLTAAVMTPTPILRPQFWARAEVDRPVNTPTPLPPTAVVEVTLEATAETPTETIPGISASIVEDSSVPNLPQTDAQGGEAPPSISYSGSKYILVDISEQHLYAYENSELLYSFIASTGMNNATATGNFAVQSKIPNAYGSTWNIWMPNWLGIYWAGGLENGIHALPILPNGGVLWEGFLGRPISYGCVVLGTYDLQLLYDWADYGTPVDIQW